MKEGWRIPSSEELKNQEFEYTDFWISDPVENSDIKDTHANIYELGSDNEFTVANRNFIMNAIVIVEEKFCEWDGSMDKIYKTGCNEYFRSDGWTYKDNFMVYCPFCGNKIKDAD